MPKHNNTVIYNFDTLVSLDDSLLGFDADNAKRTRNYKISELLGFMLQYIGLFIGNQIISGNITWLNDLTYLVSDLNYYLANSLVTNVSGQVTLEDADPTNPRLDVIYADIDGNLGVLTGQPSSDPAEPILDSATQIAVSVILVNAGATSPDGVSEDIIYSDNLVSDWLNDSTGLSSVDFDDTTNPYNGNKSISFKEETNNSSISFSKGSDVSYDSEASLNLFVQIKSLLDNIKSFSIYLIDNSENQSNIVTITQGSYGFDFSYTDDYQNLVIPFSDFTGLIDFDRVVIAFGNASSASLSIDFIRIVYGLDGVVINNTYLGLTDTADTSYTGKEGFVPKVINGELVLTKTNSELVKEEFTATANQTVFSLNGNPTEIQMVFEGKNLTHSYSYVQGGSNGTLTMDNPTIIGTIITVIY